MRVTVIDRDFISKAWGNGYRSIAQALATIDIPDTCTVCGGPRGEPRMQRQCEDGEWFDVSRWDNPCGHVDAYRDVLKEAAT